RFNTGRVTEEQNLRAAIHSLLGKLPPELKSDPDVKILEATTRCPAIDIVHLINRRYSYTSASKDDEFSRATVNELWKAGLEDARSTFSHRELWQGTMVEDGVRVFDMTR